MRMSWLVTTLVLLTLFCSTMVQAQLGDAPRVPRAMSDAQIQRWCDMLGVSDDQRHAIELEFEQYLDDFEPLRTEMADLAVRHPRFGRTDLDLVRQLPALVARTRAADEALFTRIDAILIESQRQSLPRVRMQRERTMLCELQTLSHILGDGIPDLRTLLESLDPPPEVLQPLTESLDDYDLRLTARVRSIFEAMMRLCATDGALARTTRGPSAPVDAAFAAAVDAMIAAVVDARAFNRRFFEATAPSLPEDLRRRWRDEFVLHAYGSARDSTRMWVLNTIDAALRTELTAEERDAVLSLRDDALRSQDESLATLMEWLDRNALAPAGPQGASGNPDFMNALNAERQKLEQRGSDIRKSLQSILGADRVSTLQPTPYADNRRAQGGMYGSYGLVAHTSRVFTIDSRRSRPALRAEPLLPWPIERDHYELWIGAFDIDDDARAAADAMFTDYATSLEATVKPLQELAFRNSPNVWMREPAKDPFERAKAAQDIRAKMRSAINTADSAFLEQLRTLIGDAFVQMMWDRLMRLRQRTLLAIDMSWATPDAANVGGGIDLIQLLLNQRLSNDDWLLIADIATEYEHTIEPILRQQADSIAKTQYQMTASRDGWKPDQTYFRDDEGQNERYRQIGDVNRETVESIVAVLPAETGARVRDAFNRRAYPKAFDDPGCMADALREAMALEDLSPEQKNRLTTLRLAFNDAYSTAIAGLVDVCAGAMQFMPMAGRTITEDVARSEAHFNEEFSRLAGAREEANRRALRGLRVTLVPAQMRQITLPPQE